MYVLHLNKNKFCVNLQRNVWQIDWNIAFAQQKHNSKPVGVYVSFQIL